MKRIPKKSKVAPGPTHAPPTVKGFLANPKRTPNGRLYHGRSTFPDVQWTGDGEDTFATFTVTAEQIADAAESRLLWTDQDVQRGIQPGVGNAPDREIPVGAGYPDPTRYVFNAPNADDIAQKLLSGEKVYLSPLIWNLRPKEFEAYWDATERSIFFYSGRIYLPDSHHRQQAILKAVRIWRDAPTEYPRFNGSRQFKVELYFLSKEDEGNYFFDKNNRPRPVSKSKAYDLTTLDGLSLLAKTVISKSTALTDNVNRVTDRLTAQNPQVVTLSTLREMMKSFAVDEAVDEAELDGLATVAARFYDLLADVRGELGRLAAADRRAVRDRLLVDAAVMMHGYAALMRSYNDDFGKKGTRGTQSAWQAKLERLSAKHVYRFDGWRGDFFEKRNPLWQRVGVVKPGKDGKTLTVLNTGAARGECGRVLMQFLDVVPAPERLVFLARR